MLVIQIVTNTPLSTLQVCETNTTTFKDLRLTWTDCDEAEDYVLPNMLSPRDLVFRPDIMDETVTSSSSGVSLLDLEPIKDPQNIYLLKRWLPL